MINSVFILRKSVNYSVNLFSNQNVNSTIVKLVEALSTESIENFEVRSLHWP